MASDDQAKILEDAKKLSYADRVAHKAWYVRAAAFECIGAACRKALSPGDGVFAEVGTLFVKGIGDANANVADKALEALLDHLQNTTEAQAARIAGPTCAAIASKVLKGRPATVKKACDVSLAFIEWEQVEAVQEPLFKAFGDKVPKAVVAALDIVTQAFSQFGPKVVKPQPIVRAIPSLFDAKQEQIRDVVKRLAVELSAWLGVDYVNGSLCGKMPEQMRKDVEKLMEENPPSKKQPERFTRKEQASRAEAAAAASGDGDAPEGALMAAVAVGPAEEESLEADSYEYAEPADIMPSLNKEFWEGLGSKKWSERRDSLQKLKALASQPRLATGDHGELLREIRKVIVKDSNVVCVGEAIACVGAFSKSLRASFSASARGFVPVILEKYKDPKTSVSTAVTEALSQIHKYCLPLPDLAEDIVAALNHKNPKIKLETARLLQACVDSSTKKDAAKVHSVLLPVAAKAANDPGMDVREANMGVLVAFAVKSGNMGLLDKVADGFDETRKKRLKELAQQRTGAGGPAETQGAMARVYAAPLRASPARSTTRASSKASAVDGDRSTAGRPGLSKPSSKKAGAPSIGPPALADDDDAALAGGTLSDRDAKEKLLEFVGEEGFNGLQDAQWKARLTNMEELLDKVRALGDIAPETASMLIQSVSHVPGWSEKNFQVLGKAFEVIQHIVSNSTVSKKDAFTAIGGLVEKMSDIKLKNPAGDALFAISEALGPQFVFVQLHKKAAGHKNPKVLSESLLWMAKAVDDFGLPTLNVQQLIECIKGDLGSTNVAVRNAAIQLAATCHKQLGAGLAAMIRSDVKPALMAALEDSFKNNPQQQVVPTRKMRMAKPKKGVGAGVAIEADASTPAFDPDQLLPRMDVSGQLGGKVMASLGSTNWKERNHTMEDIENIIRTANRIQPNVGDLVPGLKARLTDSNKNLVARALSIFGELAKAMGPAWERVGKPVLSQVATFLADNKKQVRDAAVVALDAWVGSVPAEKVVPVVVDFLASPKASSEGKVTGLRWISGVVDAKKASKCVDSILRAAAAASGDKAVEVREAAVNLVACVAKESPSEIPAALEALPASLRRTASDILGKAPSSAAAAAPVVAAQPPLSLSAVLEAPNGVQRKGARPSPLRTSHSRLPESRENSVPNTPTIDGLCLSFSSKKEERLRKGRFKSSKFEAPREYEVEELEEELSPLVSDSFRRLLFAKDFRRCMEAMDMLLSQMDSLAREVMSCMDLLLRWVVLRMCDANTQCLLKVLDLTKALFGLMASQEYQMTDAEANTILPCLVEKSGHNQDRVRHFNKELIRMAGGLVSGQRLVEHLMQGLSSKNTRTRVDCVELLGEVLEAEGLAACLRGKQRPFAAIAQLVSERDKALRSAALGALEILYKAEGEGAVWAHAGHLSDQQRSLIEERFKFTAKQAQKLLAHRRLESTGNASDHSDTIPSHHPPRLGAGAGRPRSRAAGSMDSMQGIAYPSSVLTSTPSLEEAVVTSGGGRVREPVTPQGRSGIPPGGSIPTPMPRDSPAEEPSPPPASIVNLEPEDDEEIHDIYTAAVLKLAAEDLEECVEGTKSICYVLQMAAEGRTSLEFLHFLTQSSVEVVKGLTNKTEEVFSAVLDRAETSMQPADSRPCKYLVNALLMAFEVKAMVRPVPKPEMRALMFTLLVKLLDRRVHTLLAHNPQIMRGLNVCMFKILGNNFGNATFESLIELLLINPGELQRRGIEPQEFEKLLTKCLVKMTKALPEKHTELHMNSLMLTIHKYFTRLGVDEIRRRGAQDEKSLRMVKTLVHELCRYVGDDIRSHMQGIPRESDPVPIIHVYVDLHLETLHGAGIISVSAPNSARSDRISEFSKEAGQHSRTASLQSAHSRTPSSQSSLNVPTASATVSQRGGKDAKNALSTQPSAKEIVLPILQRIGVSETSEQGLEELYCFMREHPEVDTTPYITRLSREFHSFVERGLQRLERRDRAGGGRSSSEALEQPMIDGRHSNGSLNDPSLQALGSRLRGLRLSAEQGSGAGLPTLQDVAEMQERMRSLRRSTNN